MLKQISLHLFALFAHLGGLGLLLMGILDSSFLVMPLGNDLLVVGMSSHRPRLMPYYAAMATAGSVLGCLLIDFVGRKGGEAGLHKHIPASRLTNIRRRVKESAGWALAFASLMPPPFPFTPFVIAASALGYPRKRLLSVIAISRFIRFTIVGVLAVLFGKSILRWAQLPGVQLAILALIGLSVVASVGSVVNWVRRSRPQSRRIRDSAARPVRPGA